MPQPAADAASLDQFVGWYRVAQNQVLSVKRDGNRLQVQGDRSRQDPR